MNRDSSRRRPTLRDQQREAARAAIVDAAEELIAAHGLHGAPLVEIAKRAGVAVGTLYNYFTDRDDLVRALFESRRLTLRPMLAAAVERGRGLPFAARLRAFVVDTFAAYDQHRRFLKVAIEAEHLRPNNNTIAPDMQKALDEIVGEGVAQQQVEADVAELVTDVIWGTMKASVLRRIADGRPLAPAADPIVTLILRGARP
ncbi:MAG: TetR/AcrR family transcriptional regulator [Proteobacteria bacterium]|nr:TetR/AcrR family transcriptional regulator [Pseudomonadota bacterium]